MVGCRDLLYFPIASTHQDIAELNMRKPKLVVVLFVSLLVYYKFLIFFGDLAWFENWFVVYKTTHETFKLSVQFHLLNTKL